ncbi:acetoacetate--CoA ligase [Bacillus sp. HNG]|uniref:acetoacetate--CoA ligase n=1 Tax=Bacillus sp. HNG TaxID=2293325 RepID=UPI000E2F7A32|nr:acetoacetate--CoA ligase [Bacillus sp. HNG]RFB12690.1 acetoacetate--CoA ligase [Bacillus sp. HNG]
MILENVKNEHTILWEPSDEWIRNANMTAFAKCIGMWPIQYDRFHKWSYAYPKEFWSAIWDYTDIIGEKGDDILIRPDDGKMLGTKWFPQAKLNFAENLLRGDGKRQAIIEATEDGVTRALTMEQLRTMVAKAQTGLRSLGVSKGDRVAGIVTNGIEGLVGLLATASIGAVWTTCSPDFGPQGIVDRIGQVKPKVLIASLSYQYNRKTFDLNEKIQEVLVMMDGVSTIVTLEPAQFFPKDNSVNVISWSELTQNDARVPQFERVEFDSPLYILYSSGTTGLPKAIVHSVGGSLLKHVTEHQLHCNVKPGDVMFWYTNSAWMMYHWLVSGLASEATLLLYDGAAVLKDDLGFLWRIAEGVGINHFGLSPKFLDILMKNSYDVQNLHDMSRLRSVFSAGAPVSPEHFEWVYENIKKDMLFASCSGGTEILGCFVMGSPIHPVRKGEITCKTLGMAVDVLDERGVSVLHQKGDLVCTEPFPSMPITFWGEGGDERYFDTYFAERDGIWVHGDLAEQTIDETVIIYGRADTTLKPGGVRIGTAEIYRVIDQFSKIQDSIVFGMKIDGDEEVVLCLVMEEKMTSEFVKQLRQDIRMKASPRHVPKRIYQVQEIPYTLNGKKVEGAVRSVVTGKPVKNKGSIINPGCLSEYENLSVRDFL